MINTLKSRFRRDDLQSEVYVRELLKLVINKVTSNNTRRYDISVLYDKVETQLRTLETVGFIATLFPLLESVLF